jgi:CspA family cold shock protein
VIATVREWSDEEGWGVLVADEVPGDIFAHFSNIQMDGYKTLKPGEHVEIEVVGPVAIRAFGPQPGQDGFRRIRFLTWHSL